MPLVEGAQPDDVWGGEEYELLVAARTPLDTVAFAREPEVIAAWEKGAVFEDVGQWKRASTMPLRRRAR